jgi:hypothetical protein
MSGIASTGTGSLGINPVFQLNGEVETPHKINANNIRTVTNLFSKKYLIMLLSIL